MVLSYRPPPADWRLCPGEIHLCFVPLAASGACLARLEGLLAPEELARSRGFRTAALREAYVAARGLLRAILGRCLGLAPAHLPLAFGSRGKPRVALAAPLNFNLSHSGGCALYALGGDGELGVDLERIQAMPDAESIARRFFSPSEVRDLLSLGSDARIDAFFRCWTRKEAYVKATGEGLALALDAFNVTLLPGAPPALDAPGDPRAWSLFEASPAAGYAAALVAEGAPGAIHAWAFDDADHCEAYFARDTLVARHTSPPLRAQGACRSA